MNVILGADAIRYPLTGIGRYAFELCQRMPDVAGVDEVRYFRGGRVQSTLPERPTNGAAQQGAMRLRRLLGASATVVGLYRRLETMVQERALRQFPDHVYHGPNYYLPMHEGPCVSTFHDLSVFTWAECHPAARVRHMQKELPAAIRRASVLVTDSEFTRTEVAEYFSWPRDRIVVAPLAASSEYRPMTAEEVSPVIAAWKLRFGGYSLFVGTLDPRKNIDLLLDVYERMPEALRLRMPLVVVGFEGWKSERTIERLRAGERSGWARYVGFVDEAVLPALYAGARVFVYPSRYEGFGLPVLEAMAAGVPVISSNAASLPEVTGPDGALLLDPDDTDAFYNALMMALEDDAWCASARERGIRRASDFSWDQTVTATLQAYALAAG